LVRPIPEKKRPPSGTMPGPASAPPLVAAGRAAVTASPEAPNSMLRIVARESLSNSASAAPGCWK
jgi:hypothetical protein